MDKLQYKGYKGTVEYSEADNCLFGKVLGLNNSLILYEGNSLDELKKDFMDAIDHYIDDCKEDRMQPEIPIQVLNIHVPSEIYIKIVKYTENHGTNIDDFISDSIERRLETVH